MRCPSCGHENSDYATRCSACGSTLTTSSVEDENTIPTAAPAKDSTAERPQVIVEGTEPQPTPTPAPELRVVKGVAGQYAAAKKGQIGAFFSRHQRALGVGLALLVVGVLAAVWLVINILDAPSYAQIESDLGAALGTYEYTGGAYGPDLSIPLSNVAVTERSSTRTPEGLEVEGNVGPTAFNVEAEATYDDGTIRAVRNVMTTYVRSNNTWQMAGDLSEQGVSLTARAGVDENKVLANMGTILDAASASQATSLADVYADGSFSVVGNVFKEAGDKDTATDDVTVACKKENGFYGFEGNVVAHFAFESGTWVLRSAEADTAASSRSYTPLVGTWTGELASTTSNSADCYGAQEQPFTVTIDSIGDTSHGSGQVSGTVTVLAHYHKKGEKAQQSTSGDTVLENVNFTGTIRATRDEETGSNLQVVCTTTGSPNRELEFVLTFGTYEDPSTVMAQVKSSYTYEESVLLFIPHQTTAQFTDTYMLSKS